MTRVIINPSELRHFAKLLTNISLELRGKEKITTDKFKNLNSDWRDDSYKKFEPKYYQAANEIEHFCKASEEYAAFLLQKAKRVDEYLNR